MAFFSLLIFFTLGFYYYLFSLNLIIFSSPNKPIFLKLKTLLKNLNVLPKSLPTISSLLSFYKNRHRLLAWYTELLSNSKTLTITIHRLGAPRTIVTANPQNVEYILKTNFANFPKGKPFTELLGDFLGLGIFNVDGEKWSKQRKIGSHEFSANSLREFFVNVLESQVEERLVPVLEKAARNEAVLDMQDVLRRFAFDTICKVSLGMDPCCLDMSKPLPPLVEAFDSASLNSAVRGAAPVYAVWKLKRFFNMGSEKDLKEAVNLVHECVEEIIRSKKELMAKNGKTNDQNDLLSRFLEAGVGDEMVRDMVISFLMAGRDTTSAALTWLFWLLSCHRKVEKKVVEEINAFKTSGHNGLAMGFDELKQMNFTKACLCESMRLYPPVVWDSKHAMKDDVLPDGTPVYKGNRVTYFQYGMGRMKELWGEDRFEFKPDRWFDENGGLKMVSPYKYPVFQAGPRVCLGKEMAFIQMKYVVASVLSRFELVPVRSDEPVFVPLLTAYMAGGLNVRVSRRAQQ